MRELIDCHIHTAACGHAVGSVSDVVVAAKDAGLSCVVLTEHLPLPAVLNASGDFAPSEESFHRYADEVRECAARAPGMTIVLGAEADWLPLRPEAMSEQARIARDAGVSVLMGSVHFLGDWPFDSPSHLEGWEARGVDRVWSEYFTAWCDATRSGQFDVMAHPDLVKKFGHKPSFDPAGLYAEAASAASEAGVMVEVSTAGLRKPVGEIYPSAELLALFGEYEIPVTVGSDAHAPGEVGYEVDAAYRALESAGYTRVALPLGGGRIKWIEL